MSEPGTMAIDPARSAAAGANTRWPGSCWTEPAVRATCWWRRATRASRRWPPARGRAGGCAARRPAPTTSPALVALAAARAHRPGGVRARGAAGRRAGRRVRARRAFASSGPTRAAAEIEGSQGVRQAADGRRRACPPPRYGSFDEVAAAEAFIDAQPGDVVVKADGLCAGKGVVVDLVARTRRRRRCARCWATASSAPPAPGW